MAKRKSPALTPTPIEAPSAERVTTPKMSKADAVRAAVAGGKVKPQEACAWIKETYGIDITPQHFSSYKSQQAKKASGSPSGPRGRRPVDASAAAPHGRRIGHGRAAELARQVKSLVTQYGADEVSGMLAVLRD